MAKLISISGLSGSGKTEIAKRIASCISNSYTVLFDEHDNKVKFPENYPASMPNEYGLSELADFLKNEKDKTNKLIVFDYPFGRANNEIKDLIDMAVYLKTHLDVAMARQVKRELKTSNLVECEWLYSELKHWENGARDFILKIDKEISDSCDFVVDGNRPPDIIVKEIIDKYKLGN